jgi:hypothetical protein
VEKELSHETEPQVSRQDAHHEEDEVGHADQKVWYDYRQTILEPQRNACPLIGNWQISNKDQ